MNSEKSLTPSFHTLNEFYQGKRGNIVVEPFKLDKKSLVFVSSPPEHSGNVDSHVGNCITNGLPLLGSNLPPEGIIFAGGTSFNTGGISDVSLLNADHCGSNMNFLVDGPAFSTVHNPVDFELSFLEGHCKALEHDGYCKLTEVVNDDVDSSGSHREREKIEDDGENEEMLGGIFSFSEEGRNLKLLQFLDG